MEARVTGYLSEIWKLRHFWLALVRIDLRNRYRRTVIGMGWSLLHPIAMTAVLCLFFGAMFGHPLRTFAPHVLSGLTFWGFMSAVIMQGCQSFFQGESYIRQHTAPLAIYPLRTTLSAGFHFLLGFAVTMVLVWSFNGFGNLRTTPYLLPTFLLLFIIGWSLTICMGAANVLFQDCQHLVSVVMQMLFYMTPIMYTASNFKNQPKATMILHWNPLASLLEMIRAPLIDGCRPSTWAIGMSIGTAIVAVTAAMLTLRYFEKRLIFYL
jgi:lipopolysaccharide transport system permease protein